MPLASAYKGEVARGVSAPVAERDRRAGLLGGGGGGRALDPSKPIPGRNGNYAPEGPRGGPPRRPLERGPSSLQSHPIESPAPAAEVVASAGGGNKSACVKEVERIQARREERRLRQMQLQERKKQDRISYGSDLDYVEYMRMIEKEKAAILQTTPPVNQFNPSARVQVFVRKRPMNKKETTGKSFDVVTMMGKDTGMLVLHEPKTKVDLTKCVDNHNFQFDLVLDEHTRNEEVYETAIKPLVKEVVSDHGCMATAFAYGQTGSGKTYTMSSVYHSAVRSILSGAKRRGLEVTISFVEIYGGRCYDLLAGRKQLSVLEDARGEIQMVGLLEKPVTDAANVAQLVELGESARTTGSTSANETSSRSHSLFQITLHDLSQHAYVGRKLSLVDLAGSERGADTAQADRRTQQEGAEINKSLLALKECIRALGSTATHVPFRGSKLTQVLRDAFVGSRSRTVLLAHVAPSSDSAEHSLNTLRYADRLKELGRASAWDGPPPDDRLNSVSDPETDYETVSDYDDLPEYDMDELESVMPHSTQATFRHHSTGMDAAGAPSSSARANPLAPNRSAHEGGASGRTPSSPVKSKGSPVRTPGERSGVNGERPSSAARGGGRGGGTRGRPQDDPEEEADLREIHVAIFAEHQKLLKEEQALIQSQCSMGSYVDKLERILELREVLDAKLREHMANYRAMLGK